jgi:Flp pilus assembly pilin Flp
LSSRFHRPYNGTVGKLLQNFAKDESGQALIEFFLLLLVIVAIVGSMKNGLRWLTVKLWQFMARKIAAPCPSCDAGLEFDLTH